MTTNLILFSNFASDIFSFIEKLMILHKLFAKCIICCLVLRNFEANVTLVQVFEKKILVVWEILPAGKTFDVAIKFQIQKNW